MSDDFGQNDPPDQDGAKGRGRGNLLRDVVRKALAQSLDARGVTEDTVRAILGDVKLPRELGNVVFQQADAIKTEVVRVVAGEVRNFLSEANLGEELAKILTSISFEIRTEIRFIPNDEALKPNVRSRVGVKSQRDEEEPELVATKESAVMDKAIRSSVSSLANRFLSRIDDLFDEDDEDPAEHTPDEASTPNSNDGESGHDEDPPPPRKVRRPDLRRRAEAVASAGRATASRAAATAVTAARKPVSSVASKAKAVSASTASASRNAPKTSAAAARPQAVVRGQKTAAEKSAAERAAERTASEKAGAERSAAERKAAEIKAAEQRAAEQSAAALRAAEQRASEQRAVAQRTAEKAEAKPQEPTTPKREPVSTKPAAPKGNEPVETTRAPGEPSKDETERTTLEKPATPRTGTKKEDGDA